MTSLQTFSQPHLDNGLARYAKSSDFAVESRKHPDGHFYIDPLLLLGGEAGFGKVEIGNDAFAIVELFIEIRCFRFHAG